MRKHIIVPVASAVVIAVCLGFFVFSEIGDRKKENPAPAGTTVALESDMTTGNPTETTADTSDSAAVDETAAPMTVTDVRTVTFGDVFALDVCAANPKAVNSQINLDEPKSIRGPAGIELFEVCFSTEERSGEHKYCNNLYYSLETGGIYCVDCAVKAFFESWGELTEMRLFATTPEYSSFIIAICDGKRGTKECRYSLYRYDAGGTLKSLPIPEETVKSMYVNSLGRTFSSDLNCVVTYGEGGLVMYDLTADVPSCIVVVKSVEENENFFDANKSLSDDGGGMHFLFPDDNGSMYYETAVSEFGWCDFESGNLWTGVGKFLRTVCGGKGVLVMTEDGAKVLSAATGEDMTGKLSLNLWERSKIVEIERGSKTLYTCDLFDENAQNEFLAGNVDAYVQYGDWVYTYAKGEDVIRAYSIFTREETQISISGEFSGYIGATEQEHYTRPKMAVFADGAELVLYDNLRGGLASRSASEEDLYTLITNQKLAEIFSWFSCIADMRDFVTVGQKYPLQAYREGESTDRFEFYSCENYSMLILFRQNGTVLFVEDYRDRTFSMYEKQHGKDFNLVYMSGSETFARKALSPEAEQAMTAALYPDLAMNENPIDFYGWYVCGERASDMYGKKYVWYSSDVMLTDVEKVLVVRVVEGKEVGDYYTLPIPELAAALGRVFDGDVPELAAEGILYELLTTPVEYKLFLSGVNYRASFKLTLALKKGDEKCFLAFEWFGFSSTEYEVVWVISAEDYAYVSAIVARLYAEASGG